MKVIKYILTNVFFTAKDDFDCPEYFERGNPVKSQKTEFLLIFEGFLVI